jgi:hypothetical protein
MAGGSLTGGNGGVLSGSFSTSGGGGGGYFGGGGALAVGGGGGSSYPIPATQWDSTATPSITITYTPTTPTTTTVTNCSGDSTVSGSLPYSVANAGPGDTIIFNVACPTITLASGVMSITNNLTITGPGAADLAVSGNNASGIFNIRDGAVASISGLTLEDGNGGGNIWVGYSNGGAIDVGDSSTATLTVSNSVFLDNQSGADNDGGAIAVGGDGGQGTLTINNSTFSGNSAPGGNAGAIASGNFSGSSTLTVNNSTFSGNSSGSNGGAIDTGDAGSGTLTVTNSTFSGNSSDGDGGAIDNGDNGFQSTTTANVSDSTFSGNSSSADGGAIDNGEYGFQTTATANVSDSTFSGNSSSADGGAIDNGDFSYQSTATANVSDSTFSGNSSSADGGAIDNGDNGGGGTATLSASVLAGSTSGGECFGSVTDGGYDIADDASCGFSATGSTNSSATLDASLGALADNGGPTETILPAPNSPAVVAIPPGTTVNSVQVCPHTDQRDVASASGVNCTIGAVEVDPTQTISFTAPTSGTVAGSATLSATGGDSPNPVTFSVDTTSGAGVCNMSGTNGSTVNYTAVGTCVVDANQAGDADYTAAPQVQQSITVAPAVPGAPTNVIATPGNAQVTLSFAAPSDGGSTITQYVVGWNDMTTNPTSDPAGFADQAFPGGSSPLTITGLTNGDTYAFTVSAADASGPGVGGTATATPSSSAARFTSAATGVTSSTTTTNLAIAATATTVPTKKSTSWLSASGLPTGVTFTPGSGAKAGTGTLKATNLASGVYAFTLQASNATGVLTVQTYTLTSVGFLTSPPTQTWTVGTPASVTATTDDAGATVTSKALPAGMTLTSSGGNATIQGTPTAGAASKSITLTAKDGANSTTATFAVSVNAVPTVAVTGTTTRSSAQAFSLTVKTTGTPAATVSTVGLPAQLNYSSSTGKITGTITTAGSSTFTVDATNAAGSASMSVTVTVTGGPVLRTGSATGPAVAVHDHLTASVIFSDSMGAINCTGTAYLSVVSNPNAPGTASLTMTSLPLASCTDFVTSASLVAPAAFTIGDSQGPPTDPVRIPSFAVSGSAPLGPVHGTTTSAGFTGTWSNTNNSVTFTNQTMDTTSLQYGNAQDTVTATFGPFTDSTITGSPLVFVN